MKKSKKTIKSIKKERAFIDYGFVEEVLVAYKINHITLLEAKILLKSLID